jgi:hypothetical protein
MSEDRRLSIGLGGLAVAPMAIVAERAGLPSVFVAAGGLAIVPRPACVACRTRRPEPRYSNPSP